MGKNVCGWNVWVRICVVGSVGKDVVGMCRQACVWWLECVGKGGVWNVWAKNVCGGWNVLVRVGVVGMCEQKYV